MVVARPCLKSVGHGSRVARASRGHGGSLRSALPCFVCSLAAGEAPVESDGCARCGAAPAALTPPARPHRPWRKEARRETRAKRKLTMAIGWAGGSYAVCVRALRRLVLSSVLFRRREPLRHARAGLPVALPQRGRHALFVSIWRHDRRGGVLDRRAVCPSAECGQVRANLRRELLLSRSGTELGRGARQRRGEIRAPFSRHPGFRRGRRADVAAR